MNRRQFVKALSIASAAAVIVPESVFGVTLKQMADANAAVVIVDANGNRLCVGTCNLIKPHPYKRRHNIENMIMHVEATGYASRMYVANAERVLVEARCVTKNSPSSEGCLVMSSGCMNVGDELHLIGVTIDGL